MWNARASRQLSLAIKRLEWHIIGEIGYGTARGFVHWRRRFLRRRGFSEAAPSACTDYRDGYCEGLGRAGGDAVLHACCARPQAAFSRKAGLSRSEERRVGKECRSRWSPYD